VHSCDAAPFGLKAAVSPASAVTAPFVVRSNGMIGATVFRTTTRLVLPLLASVVVACGDGERASDPGPQSGRLVVQKELADLPIFTEGSLTQLRIVSEVGAEIVNGLRPIETLDIPLFDRPVPEGTYDLAAVERPCAGNCSRLDPPVDSTRCELKLVVRADRTTHVAIVLSAASGRAESDCSATTAR
jgi:hypothetical protein